MKTKELVGILLYSMGKRKADSESDVEEEPASEDEFMASEGKHDLLKHLIPTAKLESHN